MKCTKADLLLYAVTDRSWVDKSSLEEQVKEALEAGVTCLQLREKHLLVEDFIEEAKEIKKLTDFYNVPFIINDEVEVALAVEADGVHVGQKDREVEQVRKLIGPNKILGVSAQTVEQAIHAEAHGADYLGVGAVFTTSTKQDAKEVSFETLQEICSAVHIPVVAIGGINERNILALKDSGIAGVAVISALFASENIREATAALKRKVGEVIGVANE